MKLSAMILMLSVCFLCWGGAASHADETGAGTQASAIEVTVKSDGSPAAEAYAAYYKALMAGDVPTIRKLVIKKNADRLDAETAEMIVGIAQATHPTEIVIATVSSSDGVAELKVTGSADVSEGTGTIEMAVEDGQWKVVKDKWKFQD